MARNRRHWIWIIPAAVLAVLAAWVGVSLLTGKVHYTDEVVEVTVTPPAP